MNQKITQKPYIFTKIHPVFDFFLVTLHPKIVSNEYYGLDRTDKSSRTNGSRDSV